MTEAGNIQARSNRELPQYTDSETEESDAIINVNCKK